MIFQQNILHYFLKLYDPREGAPIKNPINEPFDGLKKSQIEEYIDEYFGSGIQHVAITTKDIITTIKAMRANGVEFLSTPPDTYYKMLKEKGWNIKENVDELTEIGNIM